MNSYRLYEKLKESYETSTQRHNRFQEVIENIKWDHSFHADGEVYFMKDDLTLTVENINPFLQKWKPNVMFSDGSIIEL